MFVFLDVLTQKDVGDISSAQRVALLREQVLLQLMLFAADYVWLVIVQVFDQITVLTLNLLLTWLYRYRSFPHGLIQCLVLYSCVDLDINEIGAFIVERGWAS